jgi:prevent-host-death family protein
MTEVSVREFKNNLSQYLQRARNGEQVVVTSRGKPVATVTSPPTREKTLDEKLDDLAARGILTRAQGKYVARMPKVRLRGEGPTASEIVLQNRR